MANRVIEPEMQSDLGKLKLEEESIPNEYWQSDQSAICKPLDESKIESTKSGRARTSNLPQIICHSSTVGQTSF